MSTTYSLCCYAKKVKLWVGQSDYLYEGEDHVQKLARFLHSTRGEQLVFVCDYSEEEAFLSCEEFER